MTHQVEASAKQQRSACYFLTWNIKKKKKAFDLVISHLSHESTVGPCIAALQEVPDVVTAETVIEQSGDRLRVVKKSRGQRVLFIHSRDVQAQGFKAYDRMVGATFFGSMAWGGLQVLGVHLADRWGIPPGEKRGKEASRWEANLRDFWTGGPLIALGDFNADPYHREVCARDGGFFAIRDRDDLIPRAVNRMARLPLYNPMWHYLSERQQREDPRGTHYYDRADEGIGVWLYDQIFVSPDLVDRLLDRPTILHQMGDKSLVTKRDGRSKGGKPRDNFSDHLPVHLTVDLEGAHLCRIQA